jgi:hypothetical protein
MVTCDCHCVICGSGLATCATLVTLSLRLGHSEKWCPICIHYLNEYQLSVLQVEIASMVQPSDSVYSILASWQQLHICFYIQ